MATLKPGGPSNRGSALAKSPNFRTARAMRAMGLGRSLRKRPPPCPLCGDTGIVASEGKATFCSCPAGDAFRDYCANPPESEYGP